MGNLAGFDASQVEEMKEFSAIPEGDYIAIITGSEEKTTKNGNGRYLQLNIEVLDGQYKGRKLWARLNLWNQNATAVDIAQRELGAICKAVGVLRPNDSSELHNKPMLVSVGVELDDRNKESNTLKKYSPATANINAPTQQFNQQPMGQPMNAQGGMQQPTAQAQPATAAPWARS